MITKKYKSIKNDKEKQNYWSRVAEIINKKLLAYFSPDQQIIEARINLKKGGVSMYRLKGKDFKQFRPVEVAGKKIKDKYGPIDIANMIAQAKEEAKTVNSIQETEESKQYDEYKVQNVKCDKKYRDYLSIEPKGDELTKVKYQLRDDDKNEIVFVDVDKILKRHANDQPDYDIQIEKNKIENRVDKAKVFIAKYLFDQRLINPITCEREDVIVAFEPSIASIEEGKLVFIDGRHRILAAKESGLNQVAIEVPKLQVELFKRELGIETTPTEVIEQKPILPENEPKITEINNFNKKTIEEIDNMSYEEISKYDNYLNKFRFNDFIERSKIERDFIMPKSLQDFPTREVQAMTKEEREKFKSEYKIKKEDRKKSIENELENLSIDYYHKLGINKEYFDYVRKKRNERNERSESITNEERYKKEISFLKEAKESALSNIHKDEIERRGIEGIVKGKNFLGETDHEIIKYILPKLWYYGAKQFVVNIIRKLGGERYHKSGKYIGGSVYYKLTNGENLRISDHELPYTEERKHNRSVGIAGDWIEIILDTPKPFSELKTEVLEIILDSIGTHGVSVYYEEDTKEITDKIEKIITQEPNKIDNEEGSPEKIIETQNSKSEIRNPKPEIKEYSNAFEINKAIERLIDWKKENNETEYSSEEKVFIENYSGYGGLEKLGGEGKGLLSEYYTPDQIIFKMWGLAHKHGFKGSDILEPSVGTGRFFKYAPTGSNLTGYEINPYSTIITKVLYPNSLINVLNGDQQDKVYFEQLFIRNNYTIKNSLDDLKKYDLVIGNPPYGNMGGKYAGMGEQAYTHAKNYVEYFILRGLDLLKPGGLLVYIIGVEVSAGGVPFLKQGMTKTKEMIAERADLLDAYRLPNGVFETTDVLTDIVVFRKK